MESSLNIVYTGNMAQLQVVSDKICNDLFKYNIWERKTWTYEPVMLNKEMMPHFLRGFLDGDGSIPRKKNKNIPSIYIIAYCGNPQSMKFIANYLSSIKIETRITTLSFPKYSHEFSDLTIHGATNKYCFLKYIYQNATVYLERKYKRAQNLISLIENNVTNRAENTRAVEFYHKHF